MIIKYNNEKVIGITKMNNKMIIVKLEKSIRIIDI
jgi:hypothetical protein